MEAKMLFHRQLQNATYNNAHLCFQTTFPKTPQTGGLQELWSKKHKYAHL